MVLLTHSLITNTRNNNNDNNNNNINKNDDDVDDDDDDNNNNNINKFECLPADVVIVLLPLLREGYCCCFCYQWHRCYWCYRVVSSVPRRINYNLYP